MLNNISCYVQWIIINNQAWTKEGNIPIIFTLKEQSKHLIYLETKLFDPCFSIELLHTVGLYLQTLNFYLNESFNKLSQL